MEMRDIVKEEETEGGIGKRRDDLLGQQTPVSEA